MANHQAQFLNITSISSGDLHTLANPDGSDFTEQQIIEPFPGLVKIDINIWGKASSSFNPKFRVYREDPILKKWCKTELTVNLTSAITNTSVGEYRGMASLSVGPHRCALALEEGETGAALIATWQRTAIQSV